MGSHEDCINRYLQSFAKFSKPGEFDMALNYDDSIVYTDYVLSEVYKYADANLNLQAMLYFSNHGGDPTVSVILILQVLKHCRFRCLFMYLMNTSRFSGIMLLYLRNIETLTLRMI